MSKEKLYYPVPLQALSLLPKMPDTPKGLPIELEGHDIVSFSHPKFCQEERRESVFALPPKWNSIDDWNREHGYEYLIKKCKYCSAIKKEE